MAKSRQEYFILQNDVPIAKTNSFFRALLRTQNADHVLRGELLVKEAQPYDGNHAMYSLALDKSKKVSCSNNDVAPLSEDDYEWLVALQKPLDRLQVYTQRDKFEEVKKMQVGNRVWVTLPVSDGAPSPLSGSFCYPATVQYIGPIQDMPGQWAGVELQENRGSSDGTFRESRYFMCDWNHGAFLTVNNILSVSTISVPPARIAARNKLLLSANNSATDRDFYLDDQVVIFDKDGRRVSGVAKWAAPGKEYGLNGYIIGIEMDMPIKKEKVADHISSMGYLFATHDYKKHSYFAVLEQFVLKEGDGTPVDPHPETIDDIYSSTHSDVTVSGQDVPSATSVEYAATEFLREQPQDFPVVPAALPPPLSYNLEVGSAVELVDPPGYGTIRWIGKFPGVGRDIAGVELNKKVDGCGDGSWKNERYFTCDKGHALFVVFSKLKPDLRHRKGRSPASKSTGQTSCSCECQLVKEQVTEIKAKVHYHDEQIATVKGQLTRSHQDSVKEIDVQLSEHKRQVRGELATVKGQVVSCGEALQAKDKHIEELQEEIQAFQQKITDLREERLQREGEFAARFSAMEAQMRALQPPWAIPEAELQVTETILGKGAYGEVRVGVYHGDRVAVKRLHNIIASDYYHKMIQREMGIAARLRHPKLVLFIGAVTTGNLTIVTELMETSLRSELEHDRLKEAHLLPISRDIACALCYLHSLPEPIIHRDVSSANVLLNSRQGGWTAKLGDYGSANFQAKLQTVGPGCPVYAAPEASRPEEQGPKMDVYSYGVLLLEICTGTLPDPRDLPTIQQAVRTWGQPKRQLGVLASQCTLQSSDRRPHMRTVVTQLNGM